MPNRILQEKICVSETIAELSAEEERFFYRLLVQCDDFGRFDGRPSVIRARCFALQLDSVADGDVEEWLGQLIAVGLVSIYIVDGRPFLQVTTWQRYQQTRAQRSKFPDPGDVSHAPDSNGYHAPTNVPDIREARNENRSPGSDEREALLASPPEPPPQAGGGNPPTPRLRGTRKSRGRANGVAHHDEPAAEPVVELAPASDDDRAAWTLALEALRAESASSTWAANVAKIDGLVPIGRAADGGLHLRAPPGRAQEAQRFKHLVARALLDAGDEHGARVAIVE